MINLPGGILKPGGTAEVSLSSQGMKGFFDFIIFPTPTLLAGTIPIGKEMIAGESN